MDTRTSDFWQTKPGSFDVCKTRFIDFEEDYPIINCTDIEFNRLVNCNDRKHYTEDSLVSTFLDDYHLERFWNRHEHYYTHLRLTSGVMSPDFSILIGMPDPMQRWQVYRNRFVGYKWKQLGLNVVPTISWSDENSFEYCFQGVARGSIVAVSSIGMTKDWQLPFFMAGYNALIEAIDPRKIIFMASKKYRHLFDSERIRWVNSHFENKRQEWQAKKEQGENLPEE